jgi:carbon-monoxide dehydrogenase medium subunit
VKPAQFEYQRVESAEEAVDVIGRLGADAKYLAGGQSLVPMMNFRLARPSALVDISRIASLDYIRRDGDVLRIGALTRHRTVETSTDPALLDGYGVLARAARWIGHYPIRTVGTFGGSIAHADPVAEWCLMAQLLDADMIALGPRGRRTIPASSFFAGFLSTSLEQGEMLVEVRFPRPAGRAAICEVARRQGDFAIVAAAVALDVDGTRCSAARICLGGVDSVPRRVEQAEEALRGADISEESFAHAARIAASAVSPQSDSYASDELRRDMVAALLRRALREAVTA